MCFLLHTGQGLLDALGFSHTAHSPWVSAALAVAALAGPGRHMVADGTRALFRCVD